MHSICLEANKHWRNHIGLQRIPDTKCDTDDLISVFNTPRALWHCVSYILYIATSRHGNKSHTQSGGIQLPTPPAVCAGILIFFISRATDSGVG